MALTCLEGSWYVRKIGQSWHGWIPCRFYHSQLSNHNAQSHFKHVKNLSYQASRQINHPKNWRACSVCFGYNLSAICLSFLCFLLFFAWYFRISIDKALFSANWFEDNQYLYTLLACNAFLQYFSFYAHKLFQN